MFVWASSFVALRLCVYVRVSCVRWYAGGSDKALVSIHNAKPPKNIRVKRDNMTAIRDPMSSATRAELDAKYSPLCCSVCAVHACIRRCGSRASTYLVGFAFLVRRAMSTLSVLAQRQQKQQSQATRAGTHTCTRAHTPRASMLYMYMMYI